jgi:capsular polysaccharide biosynthesis protein
METIDYWDVIRRRLTILVAVPAMAVAIVASVVLVRPAEYRATATVAGSALIGGEGSAFTGTNATKQFTDNFVALVTSDGIAARVAAATKVPEGRVSSGVGAKAVGISPVINVTYRTSSRATAGPVAKAAAREALRAVLRVDVDQEIVSEAERAVVRAQEKTDEFLTSTGLTLSDVSTDVEIQQIATLEQQALQAASRGELAGAARINAAAEAAKAALAKNAPNVRAYSNLDAAEKQAVDRLAEARTTLARSTATLAAAEHNAVISLGSTRKVSPLREAGRKGGAALAIGAALGAVLAALLELASRRPQSFTPVNAQTGGPNGGPARRRGRSNRSRNRRRAVPRRA